MPPARERAMADRDFYCSFLNRDRLIHILDADAGACEALSVLFRLEGFRTAFSIDLRAFTAAFGRRRPDAAIVSLDAGHDDGLAVLRRLKSLRIPLPVFVLVEQQEVDAAVTAMKAGAADVFAKPVDTEHLVGTVRDALQQVQYSHRLPPGRRPLELRGFIQLTPRERQVLQLISNGRSNKEAGEHLGISSRTIEVHRARVMEKLGARNTADLMRIVLAG
jgi:FixJ family two-component response regulator